MQVVGPEPLPESKILELIHSSSKSHMDSSNTLHTKTSGHFRAQTSVSYTGDGNLHEIAAEAI